MIDDETLKKEKPQLYEVARLNGTEPPFSSEFLHVTAEGVFKCAVCGADLFTADTKFDSESGWPSFTEPIESSHVTLRKDERHGLERVEVRCANCDAHLGHLFPDGPVQSDGNRGNRYCINGISLDYKRNPFFPVPENHP